MTFPDERRWQVFIQRQYSVATYIFAIEELPYGTFDSKPEAESAVRALGPLSSGSICLIREVP